MKKLHHSVLIQAPKEKVWNTMFDEHTYSEWTKVFNPDSHFVGNWKEGSEIRFIGTDTEGTGEIGGMISRIKENRLHEFMSIEHVGVIENGVVDTTSEKVKKWAPSFENYTFTEKDGGTEVTVDMEVEEEFEDMFEILWPKALQALKELSEK